jgi:hypothetical protein
VIGEPLLRFARKRPWNDNLDRMKRVPPTSLRDIQHVIQGRRAAFGGAAYESFSRCTENSAFSRVEESIHQDFLRWPDCDRPCPSLRQRFLNIGAAAVFLEFPKLLRVV